jgi:urease accessory protein
MSTDELHEYEVNMLQLSDSLFPTGMYSTSSGLETFFYQKRVRNAAELQMVLEVFIANQIGPADCVALGNSYDSTMISDMQKLEEADQRLFSMKLVKEIREVSVRSGTQLLKCIREMTSNNVILQNYQTAINNGKASGIYPVALGLTTALFGIPKNKSGLILIYTFTASVVGAALRLGIINHFEGQRIINALKPIMSKSVEKNINKKLVDMWQFTPEIDITQMSHEQAERRMFIT